jgi:hypothetical protein
MMEYCKCIQNMPDGFVAGRAIMKCFKYYSLNLAKAVPMKENGGQSPPMQPFESQK